MKWKLKTALGAAALIVASQAMAQITFYEHDGFQGQTFSTDRPVRDFERRGFNDRASSIVVDRGRWEVCEDANFQGRCVVLRRGNYDSLSRLGLNDRISSVRPVDERRRYDNEVSQPQALAEPSNEFRRRPSERLFEVPVSSVHAVVGPPNQRCWVERQQVQAPNQPNVGGALVGGLIGGILGHQIGGGSGKDLATAGGAVAGAVIGSNAAGGGTAYNDVQRCENVQNATPAYWDVTYFFRGAEHHVQMTAPPGRTVLVNGNGEPRV